MNGRRCSRWLFGAALVVALPALGRAIAGCDLSQVAAGKAGSAEAGSTDGGDGGLVGAGCGTESQTKLTLCRATSVCPDVVVDGDAFPHCGFRIQANVADLVCGCGEAICSMGPFTTCAQAAQLLTGQTEQGVCMQVAEGRCPAAAPAPSSTSTCDRQCLSECGGGAGCASLCNCQ